MAPGRWRRSAALLALALVAAIGLCAAWYRTRGPRPAPVATRTPDTPVDLDPEAEVEPRAPSEREAPDEVEVTSGAAPAGEASAPAARSGARRRFSHLADPCRPAVEPSVPEGYSVLTAQGVRVAWPPDEVTLLEPTALAYVAAGLLEEAALLTDTERREQLTLVLYPSREALATVANVPKWAGGAYDGAVRLAAEPRKVFDVNMETLRHELMHAQLHTGAGCMPLWFNEGVAMYFAGRPPRSTWIRMLRKQETIDLASMESSTLDESSQDVEIVYGQSLAMVLYTLERSGEGALVRAVEDLSAFSSDPSGRDRERSFWARRHPRAGERELLDFMSRRVFGLSPGRELDEVLAGRVCCHGLSRIAELGCRRAPPGLSLEVTVDESRSPVAFCE